MHFFQHYPLLRSTPGYQIQYPVVLFLGFPPFLESPAGLFTATLHSSFSKYIKESISFFKPDSYRSLTTSSSHKASESCAYRSLWRYFCDCFKPFYIPFSYLPIFYCIKPKSREKFCAAELMFGLVEIECSI